MMHIVRTLKERTRSDFDGEQAISPKDIEHDTENILAAVHERQELIDEARKSPEEKRTEADNFAGTEMDWLAKFPPKG